MELSCKRSSSWFLPLGYLFSRLLPLAVGILAATDIEASSLAYRHFGRKKGNIHDCCDDCNQSWHAQSDT